MRQIFIITFLVLFLAQYSVGAATAQDGNQKAINMKLENEPISQTFKRLEKITGYKILFIYDELEQFTVTANIKAADISQALKQIIGNKPLAYTIDGQFINITLQKPMQKNDVFVLMNDSIERSLVVLQGKVVDSDNEPLPGTNVAVKGKAIGTVTADDGSFVLQLDKGESVTVSFSFIGMKTEELMFLCNEDLEGLVIRLNEDSAVLSEVVVTGMFNKARESYTGAATSITKEQLKDAGNSNVLTTIANIDPSFNIIQNDFIGSDPNALPDITIRGSTSLTTDVRSLQSESSSVISSNLPLFIMDGFEISLERMNDLDENQVENITLLKDASATALYGTRGANGVVVITTKKPEAGRLRVTYKGTLSLEIPDLTSMNLMNAREKLRYEKLAGLYADESNPNNQQGLDDLYNARKMELERGVDTYWLKYPVRTGVGNRHSLRVEGGDDIFRYSGNLSHNNIEGAMKGSNRNTFNGGVFLSYKYENLTFQNDLQITSSTAKNSPYGSFSTYSGVNSYFAPYDSEGNIKKILEEDVQYTGIGQTSRVYNPLYNALLAQKDQSSYQTIQNNFSIVWHLLPELFFRGQLGIISGNNHNDIYIAADNTLFDDYAVSEYGRKGTYDYGTGNSSTYEINMTANYSKTFNQAHALYAGLGFDLSEKKSTYYLVKGEGLTNSNLAFLGAATSYYLGTSPTGSENTIRRIGIIGNVNYTYSQRYFVDATLKSEGSSQFGQNRRFAPFWSIGTGWNIHHEDFLEENKLLDVARIRTSYGTSGSQSFSPYQALTSYSTIDNYHYVGYYGVSLMGIGNNDLKWQMTKQFNMGFDLEFLNCRFNISGDYYNKLTDDLLSDVNLPSSAGFSSFKSNVGQVLNRGFELGSNVYILRDHQKGVYWSVGGTIIHNVNRINKISNYLEYLNSLMEDEENVNPSFMYKEGENINTIFAVKSLGIDPSNGKEIFVKRDGSLTYIWDSKDKVASGINEPKYLGNINTRFRYKEWTLSTILSYRFGGQVYNNTLVGKVENIYPYNNADRRALYDRWSPENPNARYKAVNDFTTTYASSRFVENENTLRGSSLSLTYEVPLAWLNSKNLPFQYLALSGYAEDIFYVSTVRRERGTNYPYARNFTLSVTARF